MSIFPRFPGHNDPSLRPLFRLIDDPFIHGTQLPHHTHSHSSGPSSRIFQPNFDVHETKDAYVLDGELPGVSDKSQVTIEFVDSQTLVIRGRVERNYDTANDKDKSGTATPAEKDKSEKEKEKEKAHQPTVTDEAEENAAAKGTTTTTEATASTSSSSGSQEIATSSGGYSALGLSQPARRYWVSERSVGEFHRSFSFPQGIDQEAVKATLNHGILSITVPKKVMKGTRKINIE